MSRTLTAQDRLLRAIPERDWQAQADNLAAFYGWLHYHPPDNRPVRSRRTGREYVQNVRRGFPDSIYLHPRLGLLLVVEHKTETGTVTDSQREWLDAFARVAGVRVEVLRPSDKDRLAAMLDPKRLEGWDR